MSRRFLHDGSRIEPMQQGPTTRSFLPLEKAYLYRQKFQHLAPFYKALPISSKGPGGSFLIEETEPTHVGCGLVEWERKFATVPKQRQDFEFKPHAYQYRNAGSVGEITLTVRHRVVIDYIHTLDPMSIELLTAFRLTMIGSVFLAVGVPPAVDAVEKLAQNTEVRRWRGVGNIWERINRYVPAQIATALP